MKLDVSSGLGSSVGLSSGPAAYLNFDTKQFETVLDNLERQILPTAISNALNRVVAIGRQEVQKKMDLKLDRVTPYAKRGVSSSMP